MFALTKLGKRVSSSRDGDDEELRVLQFLRENKTGTDSELEVAGAPSYVVRHLKERGLVKELTQG